VHVGIFPKLPKERSSLLFRAKWGEGTNPELPGKGEGEAEGWGQREFPGSTHEGLLVITAVQVDPARGSTGALEARGDLNSWAMETMKEV
jgi:hypothetical protein